MPAFFLLCKKYGLLNPMYDHFKRLGCVRCPKQNRDALFKVSELEPEKYQWMLDHDHESPVTFKPGKTLTEYIHNKSLVLDGQTAGRRTA